MALHFDNRGLKPKIHIEKRKMALLTSKETKNIMANNMTSLLVLLVFSNTQYLLKKKLKIPASISERLFEKTGEKLNRWEKM